MQRNSVEVTGHWVWLTTSDMKLVIRHTNTSITVTSNNMSHFTSRQTKLNWQPMGEVFQCLKDGSGWLIRLDIRWYKLVIPPPIYLLVVCEKCVKYVDDYVYCCCCKPNLTSWDHPLTQLPIIITAIITTIPQHHHDATTTTIITATHHLLNSN